MRSSIFTSDSSRFHAGCMATILGSPVPASWADHLGGSWRWLGSSTPFGTRNSAGFRLPRRRFPTLRSVAPSRRYTSRMARSGRATSSPPWSRGQKGRFGQVTNSSSTVTASCSARHEVWRPAGSIAVAPVEWRRHNSGFEAPRRGAEWL